MIALVEELKSLFYPSAIAVVGASRAPSKIGHRILCNVLKYGYKGKIYPINPAAEEIMGLKCYPTISTVPDKVDVVVISVPAQRVIDVIEDAGKVGVKFAVVIASGFKEVGNVELEKKLVETARKYGMRVLGPNIFGYVYVPQKLNASFGPRDIIPGNIAFITQSGALGIALMGYTISEKIGVSAIVSIGNKSDLNDADFLEFFNKDPNTKVILIYMEGVQDGKRFMEAASKVALSKPIILVKAGRTEAGARAAASHTGSLAGGPVVWATALNQSGVIQVNALEEAFDLARAFSLNPLPKGSNVAIVTNGGGAGVQATDTLADQGIRLKEPPRDVVEQLKSFLPPFASLKNPIDITGMALDEWYYRALSIILKHKDIDMILALYCETAVTNPLRVAEYVLKAVKESSVNKPITVGMVGGPATAEAIRFLNENGIPAYPTPERAALALASLCKYKSLKEYVEVRLKQLS